MRQPVVDWAGKIEEFGGAFVRLHGVFDTHLAIRTAVATTRVHDQVQDICEFEGPCDVPSY